MSAAAPRPKTQRFRYRCASGITTRWMDLGTYSTEHGRRGLLERHRARLENTARPQRAEIDFDPPAPPARA